MNQDRQNKQRKKTLISSEFSENVGKIPPQATDLEEVILGAMLLEKEAVEAVVSKLSPEAFYKEQNGLIFESIVNLYKRSEPVDIITVTKELQRKGDLERVGGAYYISTLTNRVASSANIEYHASIVLQHQLKRDLIRIGVMGIKDAYEDGTDVFELFARQQLLLDSCLDGIMKYESKSIGDAHGDSIDRHLKVLESGTLLGVPTGFTNLDRFTGGWQKSDLIVIGARPGMGKTAFVVACAKNAAVEFNKPTAIFSLEMSTSQLTSRIQSDMSELELSRVQKAQLNKEEIGYMNSECEGLWKAPLYIDDTPGLTLLELKTKARKLFAKYKIELIIIDYLQLMSGGNDKNGNREQEISTISRGLKGLAKELDIPIIALSQLSRQVENRPGGTKKPQLSDLRESGAIEQDADTVMFCYRPEYYELEEHFVGNDVFPAKGLFDLIIAKNRHGGLGDIILGWIGEYAKLTDYDFHNKCPKWRPKKKPWDVATNDIITQTNNNLDNSKTNNTFVQPMSKMAENQDFLSQPRETNVTENEDNPPPF